ncbi:MAG: glycogen synthase GlgA [Oscillospiraceae bacterium]|nr:glycogen synthase GlgA [Oscillospiraceae bacterium]
MHYDFQQELLAKGRSELPKVLMASAECAPLSKTGGLADVIGTLPKQLKKIGLDVRVITPYHRVIKEKYSELVRHLFHFYVDLGWRHAYAGIELLKLDGITYYLVDNEQYYGDRIYYGGEAEGEQYAFFSRVILEAMPQLDFTPDIVHCNDWHTAVIPMLAKTQYQGKMQEECRYLLSIHNIAFQGKYHFGFVKDVLDIDDKYYSPEYLELDGCADLLKAGCVFADRISTVSPSYAQEIRTPYYAEGLEDILNRRSAELTGILNGIDRKVFNPADDAFLPVAYDQAHPEGKAVCKRALQERMGLVIQPDVPIFAMVTRMTEQKGFDLVQCMLDDFMQSEDVQFMLLGTGDERFENFMRSAEGRYRGRLCAYIGYSEENAHLIYAGSDFFLMPSRFEPCGLGQMIAMRYGTLPIVRETGGLRDSVKPYSTLSPDGNGFSFKEFDAWEMRDAIRFAISTYANKPVMKRLITNAMSADFGFERSAVEYVRLYLDMI